MRLWVAACAALMLAACGQSSGTSGPQLPANDPAAPTEQKFQLQPTQADLTPEQRTQLEGLIRDFLDRATAQYGEGMGPAPGLSDEIAPLQPGRDHRWNVNLTGGTAYRIIGGCDNECNNVDLELIGPDGRVVASDMLPDDLPIVNFTPPASARYTVRVLLQTCTVGPCYTGARILTGAASPSAPARQGLVSKP